MLISKKGSVLFMKDINYNLLTTQLDLTEEERILVDQYEQLEASADLLVKNRNDDKQFKEYFNMLQETLIYLKEEKVQYLGRKLQEKEKNE